MENYIPPIDHSLVARLKAELDDLDREFIEIDGVRLKPSQCYHFGMQPLHVLFNTNCPDDLKERITELISKYIPMKEPSE